MEFSKRIVIVGWATFIVLSIVTIVGCFLRLDTSSLAMITSASLLGDGVGTGFYYWKSKNENRSIYAQKFVNEFADKYGVDSAIRIAEVVLKD